MKLMQNSFKKYSTGLFFTFLWLFGLALQADQSELVKEGRKLMQEKKYAEATEIFKKTLVEKDPESYFLLANAYRAQKNYLDEVRILNLMLPKHPNIPKAHVLLANAYIELDRLDEAVLKFRAAIQINPKYEGAYWGLYKVYEKKKNNYEARIILLDLVSSFGSKSKYLNPICKLYSVDSFFEESIASCQKAIEVDPKYPENHIYLALTYKYAQNIEQAEKIIRSAAAQFKQSEFAQETAGEIMLEKENWEKSVQYYQACTKISPRNLNCHNGLASAAFQLAMYEVALKSYLEACKIDRKTTTEFKKSAAILRKNKKNDWHNKYTDTLLQCN
jgi:tetratricopeptide (TPR) repeat protein